MLRRLALSTALLAALAPALVSTAPASALGPGVERGPGEVCFWTQPGQHGTGWCYKPPGYADLPESHHDKTASFRSDVNKNLYAIDWTRDTCYSRLIRAYEFSDNWSWGSRIDGISDKTEGCQAA
ncbi:MULTISPECIES: hypothetical protein [Streptomyces]|uniref:Peptidase inhibitor family I36 protein n=1 Tax=Streptomyces lasiicapitis TaxID=1923961 RepID=A0ABQ2MUH5_9ACTN|nr:MULTISPECIES: hypothetical protein [Streptomyces]QIB47051.1 hypothetical protein G3H79_32185 [Streptomyces aureoverticillatus]GGO58130.1 hypothetical protein GCM10012286_76580 [Streptomyces lasiicapitis]